MRNRLVFCATALLGSAFVSLASTPSPAAYGPGGVIQTIVEFMEAVDRGAGKDLAKMLDSKGRDGLFTMNAAGKFREEAAGLPFFDCDASGNSTRSEGLEDFVAAQLALGGGKSSVGLKSTIKSIRAECPRGHEAYAVVEFDRQFVRDGEQVSQAMRATALLSFAGGDPDFRIFHWNAAPLGEAKLIAGEDR
ncbi:MAG: hypothetical protein ACYTG5_13340 [Planctomycetota bacterium]|jgi:hypothetical protein